MYLTYPTCLKFRRALRAQRAIGVLTPHTCSMQKMTCHTFLRAIRAIKVSRAIYTKEPTVPVLYNKK